MPLEVTSRGQYVVDDHKLWASVKSRVDTDRVRGGEKKERKKRERREIK